MPYYFYGFDWTYLYIVLPCFILAMLASAKVNSTFRRYSKQISIRRITGKDAAMRVLQANGVTNVRVERISGNLTDHFDPKSNVIRLSDSVYDNTSTAAIGVACHEAGHAVQYAQQYFPIKVRAAIIPITNIGSSLSWPLVLLGILFSSPTIAYIGVIFFGAAVLFQLVTLPVEFNASRRAIQALENAGMTGESLSAAKKVLSAAALTYVAALAAAIGNMLRLITIANRTRRD